VSLETKKQKDELLHKEMKFELDNISGKDLIAILGGKLTLRSAKMVKTKTFIILTVLLFLYYIGNLYFMLNSRLVEVPGEFIKASEFSNLPKEKDTVNALSVHYVKVDNLVQQLLLWSKFGKYSEYMSSVTPELTPAPSEIGIGNDMLTMQLSAYLAVHNYIGNTKEYTSDVRITSVPASDGVVPTLLPNDVVVEIDRKEVREGRDIELAQIHRQLHEIVVKRGETTMTVASTLIGVKYGKTIYFKDPQEYQNFYSFAKLSIKGYSGTSAGAALALDYYNHAVENIANGRKIALTGTINDVGHVGQVGGVKAKTILAIDNKVDIMFVPKDILEAPNYAEAKEVVQGLNSKMKLVVVDNLSDIIDYLKQ
jgi:PDZ domain-containing protein